MEERMRRAESDISELRVVTAQQGEQIRKLEGISERTTVQHAEYVAATKAVIDQMQRSDMKRDVEIALLKDWHVWIDRRDRWILGLFTALIIAWVTTRYIG